MGASRMCWGKVHAGFLEVKAHLSQSKIKDSCTVFTFAQVLPTSAVAQVCKSKKCLQCLKITFV